MNGWGMIVNCSGELHCVPLYDRREHDAKAACWCCPMWDGNEDNEDEEGFWVHNALDGRAAFEGGEE